jgi:4-amino-4-deoxy-L-arabinose transferase-like glycosyltransferase
MVTNSRIGLTWDEPAYIAASESYVEWFGELVRRPGYALSAEGVETYWDINHEHPPMDKIWSGAIWAMTRSVLPDLTAHRLGNMILSSLLVAFLYLLVEDVYGRWAGLAASMSLLTLPRFFFHAHLAALDVPAAVVVVATVLAFWKTREKLTWRVDLALGLLWGVAVATKVNAVFVWPTLLLWLLIFERRGRLFARLFAMGAVAVPVFFLSWPWLYHQTIERTVAYVRFITVDHWQIGQWYLDQFYMPPPWHFPFVITAVVVPVAVLLLFFVGIGRVWVQQGERPFGGYLLLNAFIPLIAVSIGQSMVYDNDRLFMPAMPFVATLAAVGLVAVGEQINKRLPEQGRRYAAGALVLVVFAPQMISAASLYPHLLSYYSGLVGGVSGATNLGFEATYWCETYSESLAYLNENATAGDVVWVDPWSHDVMVYYQLHGQLRGDLQIAAPFAVPSILDDDITMTIQPFNLADFAVVQNRSTTLGEAGLDSPLAKWLAAQTSDFEVQHDGVPLISVYRRG